MAFVTQNVRKLSTTNNVSPTLDKVSVLSLKIMTWLFTPSPKFCFRLVAFSRSLKPLHRSNICLLGEMFARSNMEFHLNEQLRGGLSSNGRKCLTIEPKMQTKNYCKALKVTQNSESSYAKIRNKTYFHAMTSSKFCISGTSTRP